MRVQIAIPEEHVSKPVLDGALEAVTRLNEQMLRKGDTPTDEQLIAQGARWKPEPPGQEHFDNGAEIAKRGHGDCDDWAPLRAARLRVTGEDPDAVAVVRKSGHKRWHATVIRGDGSEDDPSLDAGMPGPARVVGMRGAWVPAMAPPLAGVNGSFIATPHLAVRPVADRHGQVESWQARADLPWHWHPTGSPADLAMVTLHQSPVSDQAIVGALRGAIRLGCVNGADPEHLAHLSAVADACNGASWEDLAEVYGPEHADAADAVISGFFGKALKKLGKGLGKVAKGGVKFVTKNPLGKLATSVIPGAGLATAAFNMASPALKKAVMSQKHKPAAERQPPRISPQSPLARPAAVPPRPPMAGPQRMATPAGPTVIHAGDPNVTLLTAFADRLQRAYEFGQRSCSPAAAPRAAAAPKKAKPKPARGVAWPR